MTIPITKRVLMLALLMTTLAMVPTVITVGRLDVDFRYGDGHSYLDIAQSVASGNGFKEPHFLWPDLPTSRRPPLWPLILSVPLRLWDQVDPLVVTRWTEIALHAGTVFICTLLAWILSGIWWRAMLACAIVALWPDAHPYLVSGLSEPASGLVVAAGTLLVCLGGRWFWAGVAVLSLLPLVRPNFLILPVSIAVVLLVLAGMRRFDLIPGLSLRHWIGATALFFTLPVVWMIRNYEVTGAFPVFLTKSGEDLYGVYNELTTTPGARQFGRWIPAPQLPGEEPLENLATHMSELEVSRYYQTRGLKYIASHWKAMPTLIGGRILYAIAPQWPPYGAGPHSNGSNNRYRWLGWICRCALYLSAIVLLTRGLVRVQPWYGLVLAGTALTVVTTILIYFGWERFSYQLTVLMIPFVCSAGSGGIQRVSHEATAAFVEARPSTPLTPEAPSEEPSAV